MDSITHPNGRESRGTVQDILDILNGTKPDGAEIVVFFIGEDGKPCSISERVALAFGTDDEINPDAAADPWNVRRTQSGRIEVTTRTGTNIAAIGNPSAKSYKSGADFIKDFFLNGHMWPIGDNLFGGAAGYWFWNILDPFHLGDPFGIFEFLNISGTGIEGTKSIGPISESKIFGTSIGDPLVLENGIALALAGSGVTVFHPGEPWQFDVPPIMSFTGILNDLNQVTANDFPDGTRPGLWNGNGVNAMANYDGAPWPSLVIESGLQGPYYRWTPEKGFNLGTFE